MATSHAKQLKSINQRQHPQHCKKSTFSQYFVRICFKIAYFAHQRHFSNEILRSSLKLQDAKMDKLGRAIKFVFFDIFFSNFNAYLIPMRFCSSWFCACQIKVPIFHKIFFVNPHK